MRATLTVGELASDPAGPAAVAECLDAEYVS